MAGFRRPRRLGNLHPALGIAMPDPLFITSEIHITPGAILALAQAGQNPAEFLTRHFYGDWGDVDAHDAAMNNAAVKEKGRILSVYHTAWDEKIYVLTDPGHQRTTILLPEES
jgi:hypothetical protein